MKKTFDKVLLDSISDMVFVVEVTNNKEFVYIYLNKSAVNDTNFGLDAKEKTIGEVTSSKTASLLYKHYKQAAKSQNVVTYRDTFISNKGDVRYSYTTLTPLINKKNICTHIIAIVEDITKKVHMTRKLEESEEKFRIIAEHAADLITLVDEKGEIIYTSPSYNHVLGLDHTTYIGKFFTYNIHPDDQPLVERKVTAALKQSKHFSFEFRQYDIAGKAIWSQANGSPVFDETGRFKHMVVVTRDISKQKDYERKLKHFANHDSLTGLPNRRLFQRRLKKAAITYEETGNKAAVIMLDIGKFKHINDTYGHDVGDEVIEEFGSRIKQVIREKDVAARLGGDEFAMLLPNIEHIHQAISIINRIQKAIAEPWYIKNHTITVGSSMGIAILSKTLSTSSDILKAADMALYEAKHAGGRTYRFKHELDNI